jgi:hypothetical protein
MASGLPDPDLRATTAGFLAAGARFVVIGGFALKRLAGRARDRSDLKALAEEHGELPIVPLPGLDPPPC